MAPIQDRTRRELREAGPVFGELLSRLTQPNGLLAVFYCAGGKDRTVMAAALLLSWLEVDRETMLWKMPAVARIQQ
jgi:Tyrosine phosphatase family